MNRIVRVIKGGILKLDLFDSGSLLRVKGEPEHKTLLGGLVSLSVMLVLLAAFYNRIIGTFNKVLISSSTSNSNAYDPPALNLSTVGKGPFMLGVEVFGINSTMLKIWLNLCLLIFKRDQRFGTNVKLHYKRLFIFTSCFNLAKL